MCFHCFLTCHGEGRLHAAGGSTVTVHLLSTQPETRRNRWVTGARRPSSWFCVPQTCPLSSLSLGFCIREIGLGSAGFQPDCREIGSWLSSSPATGTWAHYFSSESHFLVCKVGTPHPVSEGCWEDERRWYTEGASQPIAALWQALLDGALCHL